MLERCMGALDLVDGDVAVHVMGQYCFVDTVLLQKMFQKMHEKNAKYISMPNSFAPHFAGKIFTRALLNTVHRAIQKLPTRREVQYARFFSFIESNRKQFRAMVFTEIQQYSKEYLLNVRKTAEQIFTVDRQDMVYEKASTVSNPMMEGYEFASQFLKPSDLLLDIACGDGFGSRYLSSYVAHVIGADINAKLIAENKAKNTIDAISYDVEDACNFSYKDGSFNAVAGMDIIEHLPLDRVDDFLRGIRRILKPGGVFICSTPQNSMGEIPVLPCHVKEYSLEEFKKILWTYFTRVKIYGSLRGGPLTDDEEGERMLAVCR